MNPQKQTQGGGSGAHGSDYQMEFLLSILLKGYTLKETFSISSEKQSWGKFDDAVYQSNANNIFIQTKHKENTNKNCKISQQLFSDDKDFGLINYLESFKCIYINHLEKVLAELQKLDNETYKIDELIKLAKRIKSVFEKSERNPEDLLEKFVRRMDELPYLKKTIDWFNNASFLLVSNIKVNISGNEREYRNTDIRLDMSKTVSQNQFKDEDFLYTTGEESYYYSFNSEICLKFLKYFKVLYLDRLKKIFTSDKMLEKRLNNFLKIIIEKLEKKQLISTDILNEFLAEVRKSHSLSLEEKKNCKERIFCLRINTNAHSTNFISYFFKKFKLVYCSKETLRKKIKTLLRELPIYNERRWDFKLLFSHLKIKIIDWYIKKRIKTLTDLELELFLTDAISNSFVVDLSVFEDKFDYCIKTLLTEIDKKKIIQINTPRYLLLMIKLQKKLLENNEEEKLIFVNPYENIEIQKLVTQCFRHPVFTHLICPIITTNCDSLMPIIEKLLLNISESREKSYKKIVLLTNTDHKSLFIANVPTVADEDYYQDFTLKHLKKSQTSDDFEKYYVPRKLLYESKTFSEKEFLENIKTNNSKCILITNIPGMGKSTLLNCLASKINNEDKLWAININLNLHTSLLECCLRERKDLKLSDFLESNGTIEADIKIQISTIPHVIYLLIDAIDEVSPRYQSIVIHFIKAYLEEVSKIILTSREYLEKQLSTELKVIPYKIDFFTNSDQKEYLRKILTSNSEYANACNDEIQRYCSNMLLSFKKSLRYPNSESVLKIPLYTRMIAEIFLEYAKKSGHFCEGNLFITSLDKLYDLFMQKKKQIFIKEKCNTQANVPAETGLNKIFDTNYLKICQKVAVQILVKKEDWYRFNAESVNKKDLYKIGIITADPYNEKVQFIHTTFAEYFLANILWERLKDTQSKHDKSFLRFVLTEILFNPFLSVVHIIINEKLESIWHTENCSVLRKTCSEIFQELPKYLNHLARHNCLYVLNLLLDGSKQHGEWIDSTSILHESVKNLKLIRLFVECGANLNLKNKHGETILHRATTEKCLEVIQYLVENRVKIDEKDVNGLTALYKAILIKDDTIVEYLIKAGSTLNIPTKCGRMSLHVATIVGSKKIIQLILENEVDINHHINSKRCICSGSTALLLAFKNLNLEIFNYLLKNGININLINDEKRRLWHIVLKYGVYLDKIYEAAISFIEFYSNDPSNAKRLIDMLPKTESNNSTEKHDYTVRSCEEIRRQNIKFCMKILEHEPTIIAKTQEELADLNAAKKLKLSQDKPPDINCNTFNNIYQKVQTSEVYKSVFNILRYEQIQGGLCSKHSTDPIKFYFIDNIVTFPCKCFEY